MANPKASANGYELSSSLCNTLPKHKKCHILLQILHGLFIFLAGTCTVKLCLILRDRDIPRLSQTRRQAFSQTVTLLIFPSYRWCAANALRMLCGYKLSLTCLRKAYWLFNLVWTTQAIFECGQSRKNSYKSKSSLNFTAPVGMQTGVFPLCSCCQSYASVTSVDASISSHTLPSTSVPQNKKNPKN